MSAIKVPVLLLFLILSIALSYAGKIKWLAKFSLGIANLFIGIVFFAWHGTEAIQRFFALPLYLLIGFLFLYESRCNKEDSLEKPSLPQLLLLALYLLYPFISVLSGNHFPQMVTYIMPCPIVSLSIAVYGGYKKKNKLLLSLLILWGLTGVKSVIFHAYEDIILLICGIYGIKLLADDLRLKRIK